MTERPRHIVITDGTHGLPYSKGLMASSLTLSGLSPSAAFRIAESIEEGLFDGQTYEVSTTQLRNIAAERLGQIDERFASSYLRWQAIQDRDMPLVILIGGGTGVGKSTVATQLAARLGITRVTSTDAIREVLRSALSAELMPTLHVSSFNADVVSSVQAEGTDRVIAGFQEQVQAVSVGIKALIARALEEGTDIIVEGAHVVPGFLDGWEDEFKNCILVPIVMTVGDQDLHQTHFHMRALETGSRPYDRYLSGFEKIRAIQGHINSLAAKRGIPVVEAFDLDSTLQEIIAIVVQKAFETEFRAANENIQTSKPNDTHPVERPRA